MNLFCILQHSEKPNILNGDSVFFLIVIWFKSISDGVCVNLRVQWQMLIIQNSSIAFWEASKELKHYQNHFTIVFFVFTNFFFTHEYVEHWQLMYSSFESFQTFQTRSFETFYHISFLVFTDNGCLLDCRKLFYNLYLFHGRMFMHVIVIT